MRYVIYTTDGKSSATADLDDFESSMFLHDFEEANHTELVSTKIICGVTIRKCHFVKINVVRIEELTPPEAPREVKTL